MRISDSFRYTLFQSSVSKVRQQLDDLEQKISTQRNINAPSDDPVGFAASIMYDAERGMGAQFSSTLQQLTTRVGLYDICFTSIGTGLGNVTQLTNTYGTMDDGMREAASEQLKGIIEQLVTVGNTRLGSSYIFGGQQAGNPPFQLNSDYSVTYNVNQKGEDATQIYVDKAQLGKFGISGRETFYGNSKIAFGGVSNGYSGDIYSNTDSFAYIIDGSSDTMYVNGTAVTLTSGVYTGGNLAKEIGNQLGSAYTVVFDSTSRKFHISNNAGVPVTFNWSNTGATARSVLGFDNIDSVVAAGGIERSDVDAGRKSFLAKITHDRSAVGGPTYQYSVDGGVTWSSDISVTTGGADTSGDIIIDNTNNTIYRNGAAVTLTNGTYTGASLATEIQTQLGAGFAVGYNSATRKFDIANNAGAVVTFNWSRNGATAAGVLGFDNIDSIMSNGTNDASDFAAGMFIDGAGVANAANNRIKLLFGTGTTDNLAVNDTFAVKDLSIFELLKNLKDAFDAGNTAWVSKNAQHVSLGTELTRKNNAVIAFEGTQAKTLMDNNKRKDTQLQAMQSDIVSADTSQLAVEFNALLNTYQALLATLAKMQSISILNYLK